MSGAGITIIGASAGSGKTHRLTQEVIAAVGASAGDDRVDLAGLVAVTFTKRAHTELEARIRHKLVEDEAYDEAMRLPLAYLGTVHAAALSACCKNSRSTRGSLRASTSLRATRRSSSAQAFERSLDEDARAAARRACGSPRAPDRSSNAAERLGHAGRRHHGRSRGRTGSRRARSLRWRNTPSSGSSRSSHRPRARREPRYRARTRARRIDRVARHGRTIARKKTADALALLESSRTRLADGELRWSGWAKLASGAHLEAMRAFTSMAPPRGWPLRASTRGCTPSSASAHAAIFDAARAGLVAYEEWKRERRVVDFVDMIDRALDLVDHARCRGRSCRGRLRLLVVDEFQDTSPIQLALFMRLHALAGRSTWVGDRKQCIFEFAGADPDR